MKTKANETAHVYVLYDAEAERQVIGSVLINPNLLRNTLLKPEYFYYNAHRNIWETMLEIHKQGQLVDYLILVKRLEDKRLDYGGSAYLSSLSNGVNFTLAYYSYEERIIDMYRRREIVEKASRLAQCAYSVPNDIGKNSLYSQILTIVNDIIQLSSNELPSVHIRQVASDLIDDIAKRIENPNSIFGIPTGFGKLDMAIGGLQKSESVILSGDAGVGKSMLAMQIALHMARHGHPGVIYSLEMTKESVVRRALSYYTRINTRNLKSGLISDEQYAFVIQKASQLAELPIWINDSGDVGIDDVYSDLVRRKVNDNIEWFVLDYMYLLRDNSHANEIEATSKISRAIKNICRTLNIAGISIHSMNKLGMDVSTPKKSMLRGSGQIVYDADVIILMTRKETVTNGSNYCELTIAKGRELEDVNYTIPLMQHESLPFFYEGEYKKVNLENLL